ncbi:MAG TPA: NUDIX hydrolase [Candidatus Tyrphobacter sp.]
MQKPQWRRIASSYAIESHFLRIRKDTLELPDGTVIPDYYVRESAGFVMIFALTRDERVVLVRQYRYGADSIGLELPAGMLETGEDPADCARRELLEETGYAVAEVRLLGIYAAEPVRSTARAFLFLATGAHPSREQRLDPTEHIDVETATLGDFTVMLHDGRIDNLASLAAGYRALAELRR